MPDNGLIMLILKKRRGIALEQSLIPLSSFIVAHGCAEMSSTARSLKRYDALEGVTNGTKCTKSAGKLNKKIGNSEKGERKKINSILRLTKAI